MTGPVVIAGEPAGPAIVAVLFCKGVFKFPHSDF